MMLDCTLTWATQRPTLCPACLEDLDSGNIVFHKNVAFCPLCAHDSAAGRRDACMRFFREALSPDQWASYRRLLFFTPSRRPRKPLQLVRRDDADGWLFDPDTDYNNPAEDTNPVAGGSPI